MKIELYELKDKESVYEIQNNYFKKYSSSDKIEKYFSPDGKLCLLLKKIEEVPFGPTLSTGEIYSVGNNNELCRCLFSFKGRMFLSPGAYGQNFDHWAADPWSYNSEYLALVEVSGNKQPRYKVFIFSIHNKRFIDIKKETHPLSHHMWSANNDMYLFRSMTTWYLYFFQTDKHIEIYQSSSFPKHCYFMKGLENLVLLDNNIIMIISINTLDIIATKSLDKSLNENEMIEYSIYNPQDGNVVCGVNPKYGELVKSEKWLYIDIKT